jgi:hypothetical protein
VHDVPLHPRLDVNNGSGQNFLKIWMHGRERAGVILAEVVYNLLLRQIQLILGLGFEVRQKLRISHEKATRYSNLPLLHLSQGNHA